MLKTFVDLDMCLYFVDVYVRNLSADGWDILACDSFFVSITAASVLSARYLVNLLRVTTLNLRQLFIGDERIT